MKFKVGDRVKITKDMERYKGKEATIIAIEGNNCLLDIDECRWHWSEDILESILKKVFTKSDLRDGDIVTLRNGAKYTKCGRSLQNEFSFIGFLGLNLFTENLKFSASKDREMDIIKVERISHYETVFEREVEILDEAKKEYLRTVIKPFRNKVEHIVKETFPGHNEEFICIETKQDVCVLPNFKAGTMYRGMQVDKKYSLEELGL